MAAGGIVVGGACVFSTGYHQQILGGFVIGSTMLKTQIPYSLFVSDDIAFSLTDASINFKLEVSP